MSTPPSPFAARLRDPAPIILDGGLATALESRGHNLRGALWSAKILRSDPQAIRLVHRDYFLAGADVAITASYQASTGSLQAHLGLDAQAAQDVIRDSVRLAVQAREDVLAAHPERKLFVAGSVGPYGANMAHGEEYTGEYGKVSVQGLKDFHRGRIAALLDSGADVLACETVPNVDEVRALCELLRDEFTGCVAWLSFTLRDARHISDGTTIERVMAIVNGSEQIVAVGFNCIPLDLTTEALEHLAPLTKKALIVYPNSGEIWDGIRKEWYGNSAATAKLKSLAGEWQHIGARLIGGCCRMGFDDVKIIREACERT